MMEHWSIGFVSGMLVATALTSAWFVIRNAFARRHVRREAIRQSRATLKGQLAEQLLPLLPEFAFDARDARFLGAPIDYIVFDGYSDGGEVEIVLLEVKTGQAQLTEGERRIGEAVRKRRVRFDVVRIER
jgi:predicted Holliday junction resolvase-like endonuclease